MKMRMNTTGWQKYKFEDFIDNIRDQAMPIPEDSKKYIGLEHLDSGSLHVKRWGTPIKLKGTKFKMKKGDLLFARRNAYLRRVAIAPHDGLFSAHGMVFRSKENAMSQSFLPFFLLSEIFWERALKISVGSLSPTINWGTLRNEEFLLPSLSEQERIADLLWSINAVIEAQSRVSLHLEQLRQSLEWDLFRTKKWKTMRIEEIAQVDYGISESVADNKDSKIGWPIITGANITLEGEIDLSKKVYIEAPNKDQFFLKEGDLLLNWRSGSPAHVGKTAIFNLEDHYTYASFVLRIRSNRELFIPEYGFYLFNFLRRTEYFTKDVAQQVNFKMNANVFRSVEVPVPELKEQNRIVKELDRIVGQKKLVDAFIGRTDEIQKKIVDQIFEGRP